VGEAGARRRHGEAEILALEPRQLGLGAVFDRVRDAIVAAEA